MSAPRRFVRWVLRLVLLVGGPVAIGLAGLYVYMTTGRYVTTENAYVKTDLIIVTAEVSGRVVNVAVENNQLVEPGQALFTIDRQRFVIERDRRQAVLGAARQRVVALKARLHVKQAELEAAQSDLEFERAELARNEKLRANGTISEFKVIEARREAAKAERQLEVIRAEIAEARAEIGDPSRPVDEHPDVLQARAELDQAEINLAAASVEAPSRAIAANVRLQIGEYVEEGDPVLSLVAAEGFWIEANLKETDLTHLEVGQSVDLVVDAYPDLPRTGRVASLSPATGAEYALLPPQNASGNWVKVVQRVPVRLHIDPVDGAPPLRSGMSVAVSIDTGHERPLPEVLSQARAWILPDREE